MTFLKRQPVVRLLTALLLCLYCTGTVFAAGGPGGSSITAPGQAGPGIAYESAGSVFLGSDLHEDPADLRKAAEQAEYYVNSNYGRSVSAVIYAGDLVKKTHEGRLSEFNAAFAEVFHSIDPAGSDCYYTYGNHDRNVKADGPNAFICSAGCSGKESPARTAGAVDLNGCFWLWGIDYYEMKDESCAAAAAAVFTAWAESLPDEDRRPILVISHMPLHDRRQDNKGAAVWLDALNAAAQKNDLFFFWGHNHSGWSFADAQAAFLKPGASLTVQGAAGGRQILFTYGMTGFLGKDEGNWSASTLTLSGNEILIDHYTRSGHYNTEVIPRKDIQAGTGLAAA
ncbi:MAG: metallophosphoesterase [Lachnospiraceae bacterium]|nr:metallophosphoesterase [Lachnospiraceae bacterium]